MCVCIIHRTITGPTSRHFAQMIEKFICRLLKAAWRKKSNKSILYFQIKLQTWANWGIHIYLDKTCKFLSKQNMAEMLNRMRWKWFGFISIFRYFEQYFPFGKYNSNGSFTFFRAKMIFSVWIRTHKTTYQSLRKYLKYQIKSNFYFDFQLNSMRRILLWLLHFFFNAGVALQSN